MKLVIYCQQQQDKKYGNIGTSTIELTGVYEDNYCNIHDLLGNCWEWTTEYCSDSMFSYVNRGGYYFSDYYYAAKRNCDQRNTDMLMFLLEYNYTLNKRTFTQ